VSTATKTISSRKNSVHQTLFAFKLLVLFFQDDSCAWFDCFQKKTAYSVYGIQRYILYENKISAEKGITRRAKYTHPDL